MKLLQVSLLDIIQLAFFKSDQDLKESSQSD